MMDQGRDLGKRPSPALIENEIKRLRQKKTFRRAMIDTVSVLVVIAAVAVLLSTLFLPMLQVYGGSMTPTLSDGEIIFCVRSSEVQQGDIIAFYYNNKVLLKRAIAKAGDWVDIQEDGTVLVNDTVLDEPYITEKSIGECDITFPFQVPDGRWFVLGDHRSTSVDSRSTLVGTVSQDQLIGRVALRVWPLSNFGSVR